MNKSLNAESNAATEEVLYYIYAVQLNPDGRYLFHPDAEMYRRLFSTATARQEHWDALLRPVVPGRVGDTFEIALVNQTANQQQWRVVKSIYYKAPLIVEKRSAPRGVCVECDARTRPRKQP